MGCHTASIGSALMAKKKKKIEDDGRIERYLRKMKSINRAKKEKKRGVSSLSRIYYKKI
jgi:hypothetical protein